MNLTSIEVNQTPSPKQVEEERKRRWEGPASIATAEYFRDIGKGLLVQVVCACFAGVVGAIAHTAVFAANGVLAVGGWLCARVLETAHLDDKTIAKMDDFALERLKSAGTHFFSAGVDLFGVVSLGSLPTAAANGEKHQVRIYGGEKILTNERHRTARYSQEAIDGFNNPRAEFLDLCTKFP
jgi:hypothetical protein